MLTLDPGNSYALLLRGRNAFESGDVAGAIKNLEKVADLDTHPDGLRALLQAYLQSGRLPEAGTLAAKLLTVHNDTGAITGYADALAAAGRFEEILQVYNQYADRLLATDSAKVLESLHSIIGHVRESAPALETLLELFRKAGDNSHITEVYELLAHACVHSGELEKARDYYLKLTQLEPENQLHTRNYQQVIARLGGSSAGSRLITAEEGAVLVDELEATAPFIDQRYPDDIALAVRAALTDAELFVSYNMPAKAMGPLLSALPKAPRDLRLNQRLAALHTRASRFAEAAVCCHNLQQIYHDAGHPDEATRYGELAGHYEERVSGSSVESKEAIAAQAESKAAPTGPVSASAAGVSGLFWHHPDVSSPVPPAQEPAEFEVHSSPPAAENEIDISDEWEGDLSGQATAALAEKEAGESTDAEAAHTHAADIDEAIEEIRFYVAQSMLEQARTVLAKLERLKPGAAKLAAVREEIEAATAHAAPEAIEEISVEEINDVPAEKVETPSAAQPKAGVLDEFVADLESSLGQNFVPQTTIHVASPPEPAMAEYAEAAAKPEHAAAPGEFGADLEASLGDSFLPQAPLPPTPAEPEPVSAEAGIGIVARTMPAHSATVPAVMAAAAPAPAREPAAASPSFTYQPTPIRPLAPATVAAAQKLDSGAGVDLADMFGDLKQELEGGSATAEEDPETHYNLGVAFREMGLLDEAIGELQKVCQSVDHGHSFPQLMQTYTC